MRDKLNPRLTVKHVQRLRVSHLRIRACNYNEDEGF